MKKVLLGIGLLFVVPTATHAMKHPVSIARTQPVFDPAMQIGYRQHHVVKGKRHRRPLYGHYRHRHHHTIGASSGRYKISSASGLRHASLGKHSAKPLPKAPVGVQQDLGNEALAWAERAAGQVMDAVKAALRPRRISGLIEIAGHQFPFTSGGYGWSIPYGHWKVTPEAVGHWGKRHGAIGLNDDDPMVDKQLGHHREGIEIHAAKGGTRGCVGIHDGYGAFKRLVLAMIEKNGEAWLHVGPKGAAITPTRKIALGSE